MVEPMTALHPQRKRPGKIEPLTAAELDVINAKLRAAWHLVDEVGPLIDGRGSWPMFKKHRDMHWARCSVGENLNDRIDWLDQPGGSNA